MKNNATKTNGKKQNTAATKIDRGEHPNGPDQPAPIPDRDAVLERAPAETAGDRARASSQPSDISDPGGASSAGSKLAENVAPIQISLSDIVLDPEIKGRASVNEKQVEQYATRMQKGDKFPAVIVIRRDGKFSIVDGAHRHLAAQKAKLETLLCVIFEGSREDAVKKAISANSTHGLARTNSDKRHVVRLALTQLSGLSDHAIAELCQVSHPLIAKVRRQLELDSSSQPRIGRDGKKRKLPSGKSDCKKTKGEAHAGTAQDQGDPVADQVEDKSEEDVENAASGPEQKEKDRCDPANIQVRDDVISSACDRIEKLLTDEIAKLSAPEINVVAKNIKQMLDKMIEG